MGRQNAQGLLTVGGRQDGIAGRGEESLSELAHGHFIFDHQDGFGAQAWCRLALD